MSEFPHFLFPERAIISVWSQIHFVHGGGCSFPPPAHPILLTITAHIYLDVMLPALCRSYCTSPCTCSIMDNELVSMRGWPQSHVDFILRCMNPPKERKRDKFKRSMSNMRLMLFHPSHDNYFMNPGPAPRPPVERGNARLNIMPSTAGVPGNSPQHPSPISRQPTGTVTPPLSRTTTLSPIHEVEHTGGVTVLKQGPARVKDGYMWKSRYLILRGYALDFHKSKDGKVSMSIRTKDIIDVARGESAKLSFDITRVVNPNTNPAKESTLISRSDLPQKTTIVQLESDDEIYSWMEAIRKRCPGIGGISHPANFHHRVHVGYDPQSGKKLPFVAHSFFGITL